jgi:hypothetical protein
MKLTPQNIYMVRYLPLPFEIQEKIFKLYSKDIFRDLIKCIDKKLILRPMTYWHNHGYYTHSIHRAKFCYFTYRFFYKPQDIGYERYICYYYSGVFTKSFY